MHQVGTSSLLIYMMHGHTYIKLVFLFNRHCNPCGFWPAQLSLRILSRKVFTECRCQRHVKPPNWRTSDYKVPTPATRCSPRLQGRERTGGILVLFTYIKQD